MIRNMPGILGLVLIAGLSILLLTVADDASARGPGAGARPRAHVSRQGPAGHGSFEHGRDRDRARRDARSPRSDAPDRRQAMPDRVDQLPVRGAERDRDRTREDRYDDRRDDRRDVYDDRRDDRRDYYDDRRDYYDDRRAFVRGARYSASWWRSSCSQASVVVVDDYTYYGCDDEWFSRTYYGGEVVYTVTDPPRGY